MSTRRSLPSCESVRFAVATMTEVFANPARRRQSPVASSADHLDFHRRLEGYAATRLVEAPALAQALGLDRLVIKAETSRLGLPSFKILGASWATYRLLTARLGHEPEWSTMADLREAL